MSEPVVLEPVAADRAARALERLSSVLGPQAAVPGSRAEGFRLGRVPDLVALPRTAAEASELMALASAEKWRVIPAGAGTWTALAPSEAVCVVASAAALTQVFDYEAADPSASVGAGLGLEALVTLAGGHRQWLPIDPPAAAGATVGATVALGAAGPLRRGHGTPREHLLGLELVTGDGRLLTLGGRVLKNVAGYDLTRLAAGSRGALGLVTRVNLRLRPCPETDLTLVLAFPAIEACFAAAQAACARTEAAAVELLSPALAARVCPEPVGWAVMVRLQAEREAVAEARSGLEASARGARALELPASSWQLLSRAELSGPLMVRLADRLSALERTVRLATGLAGAEPLLAAHCGDGIVRLFLSGDQSGSAPWRAELASTRQRLLATGGTLIAGPSHSPLLRGVPAFGPLGPTRRLMQGLKREFDPAGVLADPGFDL